MPQFDVSVLSSQLFWLFVVFGLLYFLINKFIAPKAEQILTTRNRYLDDSVSFAQEYNNKARSLELFRKNKLEEISSEIGELHKNADTVLNMYFSEKESELSIILNKKRAKALSDIDNYIDVFHADKPEYCIKLAVFIIEKITNKSVDIELIRKIYGNPK